jgi:Haem-binding domain
MMPRRLPTSLSTTLAVLLIVVAFTRLPSNISTPPERSLFSQERVPPPVASALKVACLDCHSNETKWPWYTRIPVSSYLVVRDVNQARAHLNLSDWQSLKENGPELQAARFNQICENLQTGTMPKRSYTWVHPSAQLSKDQISSVCQWTDQQQMMLLKQSAASLGPANASPP